MTERYQGPHGDGEQIKETQEKKVEAEKAKALIPIETQANGQLIGRDFDAEYRISNALYMSRILPAHYDTPQKVFAGRQFAFELGLKPLTAMRQIAIINGTPSMFGDLPLAIVRNSGQLEKFKEFFIDEQGNEISYQKGNLKAKVFGAVCISKRKGMAEEDTRVFTLDDARAAGLYPSKNPDKPWAKYTNRMLQMRSRAWNLKDNYSDFLCGMSIAEYDHNVLPDTPEFQGPENAKVVSGKPDLNELFATPTVPVKLEEMPTVAQVIEPEAVDVPLLKGFLGESQQVSLQDPSAQEDLPEQFDDGLYGGELVLSVDREDLRHYYMKLRQKKLNEEKVGNKMSEGLLKVMEQIERLVLK